jgi:DNA-binding GntR family transcriptional regulator
MPHRRATHPRKARNSIPELIAKRIRQQILRGALAPGDRLSEYGISRELHTGQATVRESLFILAQQGLVQRVANTGTFVRRLETRQVRNLFEIRAELETLAAGLAARNVREHDIEELHHHAAEMRAAAAREDNIAYLRADMAFHQKIWQIAGNEQLIPILEAVVVPLLACATENWRRTAAEIESSAGTHALLADSLRKGPAPARRAMRKHIERFFRTYLSRTLHLGANEI